MVPSPSGAPPRPRAVRLLAAVALVVGLLAGVVATAGPVHAQTAGDVVYDGSPDRIDGSVYRLYRSFFLRQPDADGLVHWIVQARYHRYPLGSVADDFARSAEFRSRYGTVSDGAFVDLVYRNVLGRRADPDGRAFWLAHLRRGMPRGHLMLHFSDSVEFGRAVGAGPFGRTDHRGPARPAPSAPAGTWAYLDPDGRGSGVGWAVCRPVYVVANPAGISEGQRAAFVHMVRYALAQISTATGQDWVYLGRSAHRAADRHSRHRIPGLVTISFMSAPDPTDPAVAWAHALVGRNPITGVTTYLSGAVNLNAQRLVGDFGGEVTPLVATTLMHELGHVAGLDHVDDRSQIMSSVYEVPPQPRYETYRDGDRAGLARVGSITVPC